MSALAPSNETIPRRALRLSLGMAFVFTITQLGGWPMAHVAPLFAAVLLQDSTPLPVPRAIFVAKMALLCGICGYFIAVFLDSYPLVMILVGGVLLYRLYIFILQAGEHQLAVFAAVVGVILMPYLVLIKTEAGAIVLLGLLLNFTLAIIGSWLAWFLVPLSAAPPTAHAAEPITDEVARTMALNLTLVVIPLLAAFLAFGWSTLLVLIYTTMFALSYSSKAGYETGRGMIIANTAYAGTGMLVAYELIVMVPTVTFMFTTVVLGTFIIALNIFKGGPTSGYWASGLNGFVVMLGGALFADHGNGLAIMGDRVWQIALATSYVCFAFAILNMVQDKITQAKENLAGKMDLENTSTAIDLD
jgi:hypothetical protein